MGKAKRKPRPSPPLWYFWDNDCCWFCDQRNKRQACGGCSVIKHDMKGVPRFAKHRDLRNKEREKDNE